MYRIRLRDGRELEFPSIQSFSGAVRDGLVAEDAEIFHRRAERWLPVREHPHYQQAQAEAAPPAPLPAPEADVNLDAILALLDTPARSPAAGPAPRPAHGASSEPDEQSQFDAGPAPSPATPESALGEVDDLSVLRAGIEPDGAAAGTEHEVPPTASTYDLPVDHAEPTGADADDVEVPIESLAPDEDEPWAAVMDQQDDEEVAAPEAIAADEQLDSAHAFPSRAEMLAAQGGDHADETAEEEFSEEDLFPSLEAAAEPTPPELPPAPEARPAPWDPVPVAAAEPPATNPLELEAVGASPAPAPEPAHRVVAEPMREPTADGAALAGLDWAGTVSGTFPVQAARRRLPLVAAAVVLVTLLAFFLLRRGDDQVASAGLPAATEGTMAAATVPRFPPPTPDTEQLVVAPDVPEGRGLTIAPSPAAVVPDTGREQVVPLGRPAGLRRMNTSGISVAPVTLGTFTGMKSHADLMRFYNASYDQSQAQLEAEFVRAGFSRLFGSGTLTTSDGLADGRRGLALGRAALQAYREREGQIEAAYRDSLSAMGRRLGLAPEILAAWAPRPSRREPPSASAPIAPLLDRADGVLAFLQGEIGHYRLQGTTLAFEREAAAARYAGFRAALEAGVAGLDGSLITQRAVARALGAPGLPLEVSN